MVTDKDGKYILCPKKGNPRKHINICQQCLQGFIDHKALDTMFDQVKEIALQGKKQNMEDGPL